METARTNYNPSHNELQARMDAFVWLSLVTKGMDDIEITSDKIHVSLPANVASRFFAFVPANGQFVMGIPKGDAFAWFSKVSWDMVTIDKDFKHMTFKAPAVETQPVLELEIEGHPSALQLCARFGSISFGQVIDFSRKKCRIQIREDMECIPVEQL